MGLLGKPTIFGNTHIKQPPFPGVFHLSSNEANRSRRPRKHESRRTETEIPWEEAIHQPKKPTGWRPKMRIPLEKPITRWWQLKYCILIFTPKIGEDEPNLTII